MQSASNILFLHAFYFNHTKMLVYEKRLDIQSDVADLIRNNKSIGFVPTMGALHPGHLALMETALAENDVVVVSIFVNPTQFNNPEDLINYPRTLEEDIKLVSGLSSEIMVFAPSPTEIYGANAAAKTYDFGGIEHEMEGKYRPGHFDGVGTVLNHLFRIITPTRAYFGEKDFQQVQIVKKLVEIEGLDVTIVPCPIYREPSGLALSSRNKRLSEKQKDAALLIYTSLQQTKRDFGTKNVLELRKSVEELFKNNAVMDLEYFEITDTLDLKSVTSTEKNRHYRAFIAAFAGDVRLIDNIALN